MKSALSFRSILPVAMFVFVMMLVACWGTSSALLGQQSSTNSRVSVTLADSVAKTDVTGRLLVFFSKRATPPPRRGPNWFSPEPFFGMNVEQLQPGAAVVVDDSVGGFPVELSKIPPGRYFVQAVLDQDFYFANHNDGPGNFYSSVQEVIVNAGQQFEVNLSLSSIIPSPKYRETELAKVMTYKSQLLSAFHGRNVEDRALVLLPQGYHDASNRRYPVYYEITGFGATIGDLLKQHQSSRVSADGVDFIHVMLTGQCKWGHHVYADSATNGPRSKAFVEELIPAIDAQYRTVASPEARFVGGHSSGGWSSLWLQVQHADTFGGCWSTAPDPVDFRDWQGTDLYAAGANVLYHPDGSPKPLARSQGRTIVWYNDFLKMDDALGRGGQLRSFEAVFSPRGDDGLPLKCWDRKTGAVVPAVAEAWRKYDIGLQIESNWPALKGPLAGKLHVFMGTQDTFFLNRSTRFLAQRLERLGSDAQIEFFEGRDHFNLIDAPLRNRIYSAMAQAYRAGLADK